MCEPPVDDEAVVAETDVVVEAVVALEVVTPDEPVVTWEVLVAA